MDPRKMIYIWGCAIKAPTPKITNPRRCASNLCVCGAPNDGSPIHVRNRFGTRPGLGRSHAIRSINADLGDKLGASVVGVTSLHAMMIRLGNFDDDLGHLRSTLSACRTVEE